MRAARVWVRVGADRIESALTAASVARSANAADSPAQRAIADVEVAFDIRLKHRQGALILDAKGAGVGSAPRIDRALVRAISLARVWAEQLAKGEAGSIKEIARLEGLCDHYAARLAPLAFLAPDLALQILEGRQPAAISLRALTRQPLPLDWVRQRELFEAIGGR